MSDHLDLIERAKALVEGFAVSQIGDITAMTQLEIERNLGELEDPYLLHCVIRVFSALTAGLAGNVANLTSESVSQAEVINMVLKMTNFEA